jgi:O-antigen ligase/Tfp pilus assembly protein PilF
VNEQNASISGWKLAIERAPLFLSVILLFALPIMTQLKDANPIYIKNILTNILIPLIIEFWIINIAISKKLIFIRTPTLIWIGLWLGWSILSNTVSPYPQVAWHNFIEFLNQPLWYLGLIATCLELWKYENLLITFLVSSIWTAVWAIVQFMGILKDPWTVIVKNEFNGRVVAGLGNPDFLAAYLLLSWPFLMHFFFRESNKILKMLLFLLIIIFFMAEIDTQSKAGYLGVWCELIVYFLFMIFKDRSHFKKIKWILMIAAILGLMTFISPIRRRLLRLDNGSSSSVSFRKLVWTGTVKMISKRPILGWGSGTFKTGFPQFCPQALMMHQTQYSYEVNHAHNFILEWVAETGWIGLLFLIGIISTIFYQWWKLYSGNYIPVSFAAAAFAVLIGIGVDNLFDMNSFLPSTYVPIIFISALPVGLSQRFYSLPKFWIKKTEINLSKVKVLLWVIVIVGGIWILKNTQAGFQKMEANRFLKRAIIFSRKCEWNHAIQEYHEAIKLNPHNLEDMYFLGSAYYDRNKLGDNHKAYFWFENVIKINPNYLLIHYKLSRLFHRLNQKNAALIQMQKAVALNPKIVFKLKKFKLANLYAEKDHFKKSFALFQNLQKDYPNCFPILLNYGNVLFRLGDLVHALHDYRQALKVDSNSLSASLDFGYAAYRLHDHAALSWIEQKIKLQFNNQNEVKVFLNYVQKK